MVILTEFLPGSSSSTHDHIQRYVYDVFLSFRGADTRNSFTDHLYNALLDAGIITFLDDEEIDTGEPLKPELENAIKSSRAAIIVLSKNYASSTWCLDELVLILEQKRNCKQIVIPIFYHVEPTHVRKQQGSFGEAMAKHKQKMEDETDAEKRSELAKKIEFWKMALTEVADLKGKDAKDRKETDFIKEVVADIHRRLPVPLINTLPHLIGREDDIESIGSWLTDGSCHTADILTIVGMSGIGKSSLARYVFELHSTKFDKNSFVEGINRRCKESYNGLLDLQKQLYGDISRRVPSQVHDVSTYTSMIKNVLAHRKVLLVLDDVGCLNQLDALLGNEGFHQGSKIIITTKDASLTERCALFNPQVQPKHKKVLLNALCKSESLELLCVHAFKNQKPEEGYEEVSEKLASYCEGHPLALEVLGRSLQKRPVVHWEGCIKVLKKEPDTRINAALRLSFDALQSENDKELFKHIACFFVGKDQDVTAIILDACDIKTKYGITNLIDKCLVSVTGENKLIMHQLIQEMGKDLVRQESPNKPWKRSRLWCHDESFHVLKQKKGKGNLLGLVLDMRMLDIKELRGSFELKAESFSHMDNLLLLQLNYVQLNGCFKNFPEELRWLCMRGSSLKSIPLDLQMKKVVVLDMSHSHIESFDMPYSIAQPPAKMQKGLNGSSSKDKRLLGSLRILDLGFCEQLHYLGGFSQLPALERLTVRNCINLTEVCESVEQCDELVHMDLRFCYKLKNIPVSTWKLKKLETLLLEGINSPESGVDAISCDFKFFEISLPSSLVTLSLANNNLHNESFPRDMSCLAMLDNLYLDFNPIVSMMPDCVRTLPRLKNLFMEGCAELISIVHPPSTLSFLDTYSARFVCVLKKVKFNPEMSPLSFLSCDLNMASSFEIDGIIKIQLMADVEEKVLQSLGWISLEFVKEMRLEKYVSVYQSWKYVQTQMFYEFGIFSTMYEGRKMPEWITCKEMDTGSISFTIPSSSKKLKGLNLGCTVDENGFSYGHLYFPVIKISNITKNQTWIYRHCAYDEPAYGECLVCLSHWMFGPNEMKAGDLVTIALAHEADEFIEQHACHPVIKECGIGFVYEDDRIEEKEEAEDVLGYYKSWNHIIGGDLSSFQLTNGEYFLLFRRFIWPEDVLVYSRPLIDDDATFKESNCNFKAFSRKRKSEISVLKELKVDHKHEAIDAEEDDPYEEEGEELESEEEEEDYDWENEFYISLFNKWRQK